MKDYSKTLTVIALGLLFVASLWIRPFEVLHGAHLSPGIWVAIGIAFYFGVLRRGRCGASRRCRSEASA